MKSKGRTYQYIANVFGISRQRVHQIIKGRKRYSLELFVKNKIRQLDNNQCQVCWKIDNFGKKSMNVHHLNGNKKDNNPDNLITLCSQCHAELHHQKVINS